MIVRSLDEVTERRYASLVHLAAGLAAATEWVQLAAAVSAGLGDGLDAGPPVRLWSAGEDGPEEITRHPGAFAFARQRRRDLLRALAAPEPVDGADGSVICALRAGGAAPALLEVADGGEADRELLRHAAPVVAARVALLSAQDPSGPPAAGTDEDVATVMGAFAAEAKRLLEHDRLSAYLLTPDGRAVERFVVASAPIVPGEGVIVPLAEFGLRHILHTNRPLVSADLAADARIVGREDRVIARAGYHGLLSVPLRRSGRPFGVLNFVSRTPGFYRDEDAAVAERLADQISVFIENLRLQQRARTWLRHASAEHERARLARELHDTLAQVMPDLAAGAGRLADRLRRSGPGASIDARGLAERARLAQVDVRRALLDLVPPALETHALDAVMRNELAQLEGDGGPRVELTVEGPVERLSGSA